MKKYLVIVLGSACLACSSQKKQQKGSATDDVQRILATLASDDMKGRAAFNEGAEKAADFIENEFRSIGLQPMAGQTSFRQNFSATRVRTGYIDVTLDGRKIGRDSIVVLSEKNLISWQSDAEVTAIKAGENIFERYGQIAQMKRPLLVMVDPSFSKEFAMLSGHLGNGRIVEKLNDSVEVVFVLGTGQPNKYEVRIQNQIETLPLFNVIGIIPGRSRSKEIVIFSAHYDHIGILAPVNGDSIANGADDDASGVTAVISLAKHFKQLNNNERTLMFVGFAAEELGLVGSKYFSKQMNPDEVTAMFNIEMIGKESKFGKNAAFISGFERSDFGKILQKNLEGTAFTFHPDPYPQLNLFYRSDNASLAAVGVPAHTISTDQIDNDKFYHTVDDEIQTLDIENIRATINAIALSATTIVSGQDTPQRVAKREPGH